MKHAIICQGTVTWYDVLEGIATDKKKVSNERWSAEVCARHPIDVIDVYTVQHKDEALLGTANIFIIKHRGTYTPPCHSPFCFIREQQKTGWLVMSVLSHTSRALYVHEYNGVNIYIVFYLFKITKTAFNTSRISRTYDPIPVLSKTYYTKKNLFSQ